MSKQVTVQTFHPAKPSRISDKFGTHGETRKKLGLGPHRGLDYSVQSGTPLLAIGSGRVKNIGETSVLGHFIEISAPVIVKGKLEAKCNVFRHSEQADTGAAAGGDVDALGPKDFFVVKRSECG